MDTNKPSSRTIKFHHTPFFFTPLVPKKQKQTYEQTNVVIIVKWGKKKGQNFPQIEM